MQRYAVPKWTESRANERTERFFIDITGPFHATSLGRNRYTMLCVDDFTRFKFIRFLKHKSDTAKELRELVAGHIAPSRIKTGTVRTDGGGEFEGELKSPEGAGDQARDDPSANTSIQRRRGAGAWTPTRQNRGPFTRYDRRKERPPLGGSHELRVRNVKPLHDNLPQPLCLPIRTLGRTSAHVRSPHPVWNRRILAATRTRAQAGATRGQVHHAWHRHLTTRDEPSASSTSPPAKSSCVRPSYCTPQSTPKRQFTATKGGRGTRHGHYSPRPKKPLTTRLHWGNWRPPRRSRNRNSTSRRGRVTRKVRLSWRE